MKKLSKLRKQISLLVVLALMVSFGTSHIALAMPLDGKAIGSELSEATVSTAPLKNATSPELYKETTNTDPASDAASPGQPKDINDESLQDTKNAPTIPNKPIPEKPIPEEPIPEEPIPEKPIPEKPIIDKKIPDDSTLVVDFEIGPLLPFSRYACEVSVSDTTFVGCISLDEALNRVAPGDEAVIRLLRNINHTKLTIGGYPIVNNSAALRIDGGKTITFDMNGFNLDIFGVGNGNGLDVRDNSIVRMRGEGSLTVTGGMVGLLLSESSEAEVTSVSTTDDNPSTWVVYADQFSKALVAGDLTAGTTDLSNAVGAYAVLSSSITVGGSIYTHVDGNSLGIISRSNSTVNVAGDVYGGMSGIVYVQGSGCGYNYSWVYIGGNAICGDLKRGSAAIAVYDGGEVVIDRTVKAGSGTYITVGNLFAPVHKTVDDITYPTTKPGYITYDNNDNGVISSVWIKGKSIVVNRGAYVLYSGGPLQIPGIVECFGTIVDDYDNFYYGDTWQNNWDRAVSNQSGEYFDFINSRASKYNINLKWVWDRAYTLVPETQTGGPSEKVYFKKDFKIGTLAEGPVYVYFASDNAATVEINGRLAVSTYKACDPHLEFLPGYDSGDFGTIYRFDIAQALIENGENTIVISARNGSGTPPGNPAGLLFFMEINHS